MADKRLLPTGECWCGCGKETGLGSFFAQGHDKRAEGMLIVLKYGSVAGFVEDLGYGPSGKNLLEEYQAQKGGGS
jgi:hypothetical protein